jgi:hypothetical protein
VTYSREHENEFKVSQKGGQFLDYQSFIELVNWFLENLTIKEAKVRVWL